MFGLSFAEMAIILLVAVVVVGPKELPTVVRAVIRTVAQLRELGSEFRRNFDELAQEAKLQELHDELKNDITTAMPTIIDLEGKEQRTYDISEELEQSRQKRHSRGEAADAAQSQGRRYANKEGAVAGEHGAARKSAASRENIAAGVGDAAGIGEAAGVSETTGESGVVREGRTGDATGNGAETAVKLADPKAERAAFLRQEGKGGGI